LGLRAPTPHPRPHPTLIKGDDIFLNLLENSFPVLQMCVFSISFSSIYGIGYPQSDGDTLMDLWIRRFITYISLVFLYIVELN